MTAATYAPGGETARRLLWPALCVAFGVGLPLTGCQTAGSPGNPGRTAGAADTPEGPPNVVILLADDLGWNDLGATGHPWHRTPHLDALAREGMSFTTAYAPAPNCAPSRASLMTGLYSPRHGVYTVGNPSRGKSRNRQLVPIQNNPILPDELDTLAELLAPAGYRSACIGKWHLGESARTQGFDHVVAGNLRGHPPTFISPYRMPVLEDGPVGEHLTDRMAAEAVAWLEELPDDEPFLLYLPFFAVHAPIEPPEDLIPPWRAELDGHTELLQERGLNRERSARYAGLVETMDRACGTVLEALERLGHASNTVVIFSSDNGPHARFSTAEPLRGSKGMLYEGGIRVPLFVRWPGQVEAGSRCEDPVHLIDLAPTLLAMAGLEPSELDGVDLGPALGGGSLAPRELYWHFPAYLEGYMKQHGPWRATPSGVVRSGRWKAIESFETGKVELFDLSRPEHEFAPLEGEESDAKRTELVARLREWRARTGAPVPTERNPDYREP